MTISAEDEAIELDAADPSMRDRFLIPPHEGDEVAYFAGNSLGLQPRALADDLAVELADWATLAVEGHVHGRHPWVHYHEFAREPLARLVGALPSEVVAMGSLTSNLHLLMASFYRPTPERHRILIEDSAFPSDSYAVRSHAAFRGYDPDEAILRATPRDGTWTFDTDDLIDLIRREAHTLALVLLGGVNYLTGQLLDMPRITAAARDVGVTIGWDLAHAAGNVPLALHDWDADFASWCSYKYLNSGPGAVAGVFVNERHHGDESIPRLAGWWSNDPHNRFEMLPVETPVGTADAWQVSNPPILALAPVLTSLRIFDEATMPSLRERSVRLTTHLAALFAEHVAPLGFDVITPSDPSARGAQLSLHVGSRDARVLSSDLRHSKGVIADARGRSVLRFAPVPLYSTFHDCWRATQALVELGGDG